MIEFDETDLFWFKIVGFFSLFFIAFLLWKYREYQQQKYLKKQEIANEALKYVAVISKYLSPDPHSSQKNDSEIQKYINDSQLEEQIPPEEDIEKLRREFRERRGESTHFTSAGSGIVPTVHDFQEVVDHIGGDPAYIDFNTQSTAIKHIQDEPINPSLIMRQGLLIPMNQRAELPPPLETRPPRPVGQFEPVRDYTVSQQIPGSGGGGSGTSDGITIKKRRQPRTRNPLKTSNKITR